MVFFCFTFNFHKKDIYVDLYTINYSGPEEMGLRISHFITCYKQYLKFCRSQQCKKYNAGNVFVLVQEIHFIENLRYAKSASYVYLTRKHCKFILYVNTVYRD